jgi:hypothetical protein
VKKISDLENCVEKARSVRGKEMPFLHKNGSEGKNNRKIIRKGRVAL